MIILGLGSNQGDRLSYLKTALKTLSSLEGLRIQQVSPIYTSDAMLPPNAPIEWDQPYLNLAIRCESILTPLELLDRIKAVEKSMGRDATIPSWGPRIIDIDILAWDNLTLQTDAMTLPHARLRDRPFALWPLCDLAPFWPFPVSGEDQGKAAITLCQPWGSRWDGHAPFRTRQIQHRIDTPDIMGILNLTTDSFSHDGIVQSEEAIQKIHRMITTGARIIDIGAESTNPQSTPLSHQVEWSRLQPVLSQLSTIKSHFQQTMGITPLFSIDTYHPETAEKALTHKIDWINDVSGLSNPHMRALIKDTKVNGVLMYQQGMPTRSNYLSFNEDIIKHMLEWFQLKLTQLNEIGISKEQLILDPGIGFNKSKEQSFKIIQEISKLKKFGLPILMGHSRKCANLFNEGSPSERDIESLAISIAMLNQNIDILRVHDVASTARAFKVMRAMPLPLH